MKKNLFIQLLTWLAIMAVLTLIVMGSWMLISGGSQTTASLKWLQFIQTTATFLLPPILCAYLWDNNRRPFRWLRMETSVDASVFALAIVIMLCAIPAINLLADLNSRISLPESLASWEAKMKAMEEAAAALTERFLQADTIGGLVINIGLMALLPALSEELSFRGTLQQLLTPSDPHRLAANTHVAIWLTAIVFSAIHMQFYGFIPRMLLGAMFGYCFVWSGSLWVPIVMHFTNNGLAVVVSYLTSHTESVSTTNIADTIGAGDTWWLGVLSLIITSLGLLILYRRTHKE